MSGCPIHIWAPLMAAMLPFSRLIRDRVRLWARALLRRQPPEAPAPREMKRWAPITPASTRDASPRS